MSVISDNLIHFLGRQFKDSPNKQFDVFKLIIENGLRTSHVQIKFSEGASVYNQAVCFTDIPLRECDEHTSIYGKFGIGFKKSYIKNVGGNPARYFLDYVPGHTMAATVESRGSLYYNLCIQNKLLLKLNKLCEADPDLTLYDIEGNSIISAEELKEFIQTQIFTSSFDKEMGDLGPARDETKEIDLFYKEREWRLVPSRLAEMSGAVKRSDNASNGIYSFTRDDLNMIVVPNEEIRSLVHHYFLGLNKCTDERLNQFGSNPLPIINYDDLHRW